MVRKNNKDELRNAAPCKVCCSALKKLGFRKIVYSDNYGNMNVVDIRKYTNDHTSNSQEITNRHSISV